jgi:hypothetical protein
VSTGLFWEFLGPRPFQHLWIFPPCLCSHLGIRLCTVPLPVLLLCIGSY